MRRFEAGRRVLKNLKMVHHASISLRFEFPFESVVKQIPAASEQPDVFRKRVVFHSGHGIFLKFHRSSCLFPSQWRRSAVNTAFSDRHAGSMDEHGMKNTKNLTYVQHRTYKVIILNVSLAP